ncbi:MAG: arginine deiminase family protein [Clostridiales Family XIII bacterium]|uniref:dimethylarginine dimethylaminohydrolase family protein n=1 Tax=Hominibacterium faecale TaxID=2839743 RepID=UPI001D0F9E3E|nr:arginine deiminase family protein [Hominibacterium faecale]MCC2864822.1 amidinotransferase [Anaerovorax odorimutans]MCI7300860.1 arginine deiminase family protein [Clostridia bacterium]MDY3010700.1 arginine deiminase family protein [Clostridiales Family XIII bacterium]
MKYGCQSMVGKIESILIKKPEQAFISQENLNKTWEEFKYFGCPDYETVLKEYAVFEKYIKENVENVYYLPQDDRTGLDSIYTHDPLKITKKGAIYFPMGKALRSKEYLATKAYLESIGVPTLGEIKAPGKMEGGDVLWIDEKTVAIGRGYRTNDEGIRQFKELTKDLVDEYIIVPMPHGEGEDACLHLMSIISFVDTDKAVVYSKFMPVFFREYLLEKGFMLIEADDDEYDYLGTNLLALEPGKVILIKGCSKIEKKLKDLGLTVMTYEGKELSYRGTGGPTCLTCPITRL